MDCFTAGLLNFCQLVFFLFHLGFSYLWTIQVGFRFRHQNSKLITQPHYPSLVGFVLVLTENCMVNSIHHGIVMGAKIPKT